MPNAKLTQLKIGKEPDILRTSSQFGQTLTLKSPNQVEQSLYSFDYSSSQMKTQAKAFFPSDVTHEWKNDEKHSIIEKAQDLKKIDINVDILTSGSHQIKQSTRVPITSQLLVNSQIPQSVFKFEQFPEMKMLQGLKITNVQDFTNNQAENKFNAPLQSTRTSQDYVVKHQTNFLSLVKRQFRHQEEKKKQKLIEQRKKASSSFLDNNSFNFYLNKVSKTQINTPKYNQPFKKSGLGLYQGHYERFNKSSIEKDGGNIKKAPTANTTPSKVKPITSVDIVRLKNTNKSYVKYINFDKDKMIQNKLREGRSGLTSLNLSRLEEQNQNIWNEQPSIQLQLQGKRMFEI